MEQVLATNCENKIFISALRTAAERLCVKISVKTVSSPGIERA
jgi:hypothetical protein